MGEQVLCGAIRYDEQHPPPDQELLKNNVDRFGDIVPFVYVSHSQSLDDQIPLDQRVIQDRYTDISGLVNGIRSILEVLRQPVVVTPARPDLFPPEIERLTASWNECEDRLSGVFFRDKHGETQLLPALYASPLLPGLRRMRSQPGSDLRTLIQSERIRTLDDQIRRSSRERT